MNGTANIEYFDIQYAAEMNNRYKVTLWNRRSKTSEILYSPWGNPILSMHITRPII